MDSLVLRGTAGSEHAVSEERSSTLGDLRVLVSDALATTRGLDEEECRRCRLCCLSVPSRSTRSGVEAGSIARALTGEEPFDFAWEPTHAINAINAHEHASMSKETAAEEIEQGWDRLQSVIARMRDEDWSRAVFVFGGRPRSADVVLRRIVLPHVSEHLQSLRATIPGKR